MKNKATLLMTTGFSVFIGLLVFEIVFGRWLSNDTWFKATQINVVRNINQKIWVSNLGGSNEFSTYIRDKYGLRGNCKENNLADMVTIGGSTVEQKYISEGKTWQDILQKKINQTFGNNPYCIANAGVDGHSTFGHLASFDVWFPNIKGLKPKFFLFYLGGNDANFRFEAQKFFDSNPVTNSNLRDKIKENSITFQIYKMLEKSRARKDNSQFAWHQFVNKTEKSYSEKSLTPDTEELAQRNAAGFKKRLQEMLTKAATYGAKPICVSQPHAMVWNFGRHKLGVKNAFQYNQKNYNGLDYDFSARLINKEMKDLCVKNGGFYVDLYNKKFELSDFYDFAHTTPQGSEKIANYLFMEFLSQRIISPKADPKDNLQLNHS